ncbi:MAG: hypothetical protein ACI9FJ_000593 [Alteromonadaceae bacterium]|jgi:hypothetical protein
MTKLTSVIIGLGAAILLSGCNMTPNFSAFLPDSNDTPEPVVQVNDKPDEGAFYQCRDEIVAMDRSAEKNASLAQYLASANAIGGCLDTVTNGHSFITQQQMMQLQALAVLNYLKGGDIGKSREQLAGFKQSFSGRDLYFADKTSFIDTFELLLNDAGHSAQQVDLNVNKTLLAEFQRKQYWASH